MSVYQEFQISSAWGKVRERAEQLKVSYLERLLTAVRVGDMAQATKYTGMYDAVQDFLNIPQQLEAELNSEHDEPGGFDVEA